MAIDNSIIVHYYIRALPQDIAMFVKHESKASLVEKFTTTLVVEKYLLSIGIHQHDSREETNLSGKKTPAPTSMSTDKDKDSFGLEGLDKSLKQLLIEVSRLKINTNESSLGSKSTKPLF